jgi:mxaJ protein
MSSLFRVPSRGSRVTRLVALTALSLISMLCAGETHTIKVCADPDNLPYSNRQLQGYENKIAQLIAGDLQAKVNFFFARQRRGFVRNQLDTDACDLLVGVPATFRQVLTTDPYFRSTYVFVSRKDRRLNLTSFDDPQLNNLKIGLQVLEEDYAPPAQALARRHIVSKLVGYESFGNEAGDIVRDVVRGKIDLAIVWGPLAGYYARPYARWLEIRPVSPPFDPPGLPFTYAISMGVRKTDQQLRDRLNTALRHHREEIERILKTYGVPELRDEKVVAQKGGR